MNPGPGRTAVCHFATELKCGDSSRRPAEATQEVPTQPYWISYHIRTMHKETSAACSARLSNDTQHPHKTMCAQEAGPSDMLQACVSAEWPQKCTKIRGHLEKGWWCGVAVVPAEAAVCHSASVQSASSHGALHASARGRGAPLAAAACWAGHGAGGGGWAATARDDQRH